MEEKKKLRLNFSLILLVGSGKIIFSNKEETVYIAGYRPIFNLLFVKYIRLPNLPKSNNLISSCL